MAGMTTTPTHEDLDHQLHSTVIDWQATIPHPTGRTLAGQLADIDELTAEIEAISADEPTPEPAWRSARTCRTGLAFGPNMPNKANPDWPPLRMHVSEMTAQILSKETLRRCWSPWSEKNAGRPGAQIEIGDTTWLLWLDRAETMAVDVDGQPHATVVFDRLG